MIGFRVESDAPPGDVLAAAGDPLTGLITEALGHDAGPLAGACELAGKFLRGWWGEPPDPPFAPEG